MSFLALPLDVLRHAASYCDRPSVVVAVPRWRGDARQALRAGVDVAERARFPGATTVREAEAFLRDEDGLRYGLTRLAAGRRLCNCTYSGRGLEFVLPLLSYGALPSVGRLEDPSVTPLHGCAWGFPESTATAKILISAGADVDAKVLNPQFAYSANAGPSPLSRTLWQDPNTGPLWSRLHQILTQYQTARVLIAGGADISMANDDYKTAGGEGFDHDLRSMLDYVRNYLSGVHIREDEVHDQILVELEALAVELLDLVRGVARRGVTRCRARRSRWARPWTTDGLLKTVCGV